MLVDGTMLSTNLDYYYFFFFFFFFFFFYKSAITSKTALINLIKTKSLTTATRQKYQLSPLPINLILRREKFYQVSEYRPLGVTIDHKRRWGSHADNVCKSDMYANQTRDESSFCQN